MTRAKGWIHPKNNAIRQMQYPENIYIEEIPPDAVRAEATVGEFGSNMTENKSGVITISLSPNLIGKKVEVIIMEVKE